MSSLPEWHYETRRADPLMRSQNPDASEVVAYRNNQLKRVVAIYETNTDAAVVVTLLNSMAGRQVF